MATISKTKSRFEQLLSEIYARRFRENNQQVCIDCLKPRSNKNKFESKNCGSADFHKLGYQNSSYVVLSNCNVQKAVLSKIKLHSNAVDYFKELPFYNKPIEKPKVKHLKNIAGLAEIPFYEQLSVIKTNDSFKGYAMSYKVEIIERKYSIVQLEASKSSVKDFFSEFLNKTKGFKSQIIAKVLLKKYKLNGEIEFAPVYFNSMTKTVINHRFRLETSFQEILYMIDVWINKGSSWNESQYINISNYRPLSGSSYMDLPVELRSSRKRLISIKNKDQKCFLWCHVSYINPSKKHQEKI